MSREPVPRHRDESEDLISLSACKNAVKLSKSEIIFDPTTKSTVDLVLTQSKSARVFQIRHAGYLAVYKKFEEKHIGDSITQEYGVTYTPPSKGTVKNTDIQFHFEIETRAHKFDFHTSLKVKFVTGGAVERPQPRHPPCAENQAHRAEFFCEKCSADFCDLCFQQIHLPKFMSGHEKIPMAKKPYQFPKCAVHPENVAEFYCKNPECWKQSKLWCSTCILGDHKTHSFENVKGAYKKWQDAVAAVKVSTDIIKCAREASRSCSSTFNPDHVDYKEKLKQINNHFEKQKKAAMDDFEDFANVYRNQLEEYPRYLSQEENELLQLESQIRESLKFGNRVFDADEADKIRRDCEEVGRLVSEKQLSRLSDLKMEFSGNVGMEFVEPTHHS